MNAWKLTLSNYYNLLTLHEYLDSAIFGWMVTNMFQLKVACFRPTETPHHHHLPDFMEVKWCAHGRAWFLLYPGLSLVLGLTPLLASNAGKKVPEWVTKPETCPFWSDSERRSLCLDGMVVECWTRYLASRKTTIIVKTRKQIVWNII